MKPTLPFEQLQERAGEAADFMRLFGTPSRLLLMCYIADKTECAVKDIQEDLGLKQPALSQQLAELRSSGVVKTRRDSRQIHYSLADDRVNTVMTMLLALFCETSGTVPRDPPRGIRPTADGSTRHVAVSELGEMAQWARLDGE